MQQQTGQRALTDPPRFSATTSCRAWGSRHGVLSRAFFFGAVKSAWVSGPFQSRGRKELQRGLASAAGRPGRGRLPRKPKGMALLDGHSMRRV